MHWVLGSLGVGMLRGGWPGWLGKLFASLPASRRGKSMVTTLSAFILCFHYFCDGLHIFFTFGRGRRREGSFDLFCHEVFWSLLTHLPSTHLPSFVLCCRPVFAGSHFLVIFDPFHPLLGHLTTISPCPSILVDHPWYFLATV